MSSPTLRRWAPMGLPISMLLVGLWFRLAGVLPGWGTMLIVAGVIGAALAAFAVVYGSHDRPLDLESLRASEDSKC